MKQQIICILCVVAGLVLAGDKHINHSTTTYLIVPVADIDAAMLATVAQTSANPLRLSTNGTLAVLKFVRCKKTLDPTPIPDPNDEPLTDKQLDYNDKFAGYPWAAKKTPSALKPYKQFSYAQILLEIEKPEWNPQAAVTNGAAIR